MANHGWLTIAVLLAATGCGQKQSDNAATQSEASASGGGPVLAVSAPSAAPAQAPAATTVAVNVALPQIAYTYDYTLELPAKAVVPLFERHRAACEAAGPARCQIIGAQTESVGGTDTSATLTLRAETGWLTAFRARLGNDATGADGRIAGSRTASEDLGREISDTGARVRALTTLQGRLETLLASRTGKLSDLLEIERELARVGGELDATRSALADMRGRVTLPKATIVYQPVSLVVAGAGRTAGLGGQLYAVITASLFTLLNVVAAVLPWLLVIVPLGWLIRWLVRRRKG